MSTRILTGDVRAVLPTLADRSVHCVVTSPPYLGLRSYLPADHANKHLEIGSERTVEKWVETLVEVFREVRRVLRDDGCCFVNLGDSYAGSRAGGPTGASTLEGSCNSQEQAKIAKAAMRIKSRRRDDHEIPRSDLRMDSYKAKDLIGQAWILALALRQPYYTGRIKSERDRVWLAAMIDGEGCFFIHKRKAGTPSYSKFKRADGSEANYSRTADTFGVSLEICNTQKAIIDRVQEIAGAGTVTTQSPQQNARRKQTIYRWRIAPNEAKRIAQEVYPHLVGKRHQARLIFNCPSSGEAGAAAHQALMDLHNGVETDVDYPAPPTLFEDGWYLRQDVIWSKPNAMPESVRDRCTKSHEYVFVLSKKERYFWNFEAIQEPVNGGAHARFAKKSPEGWDQAPGRHGASNRAYAGNGVGFGHGFDADPKERVHRPDDDRRPKAWDVDMGSMRTLVSGYGRKLGDREATGKSNPSYDAAMGTRGLVQTRNLRSVWTIPTHPFKGAHFATFPPALAERCVRAGCPPGGVVLDPFGGSGTVAMVAEQLGCDAVLIDIDERTVPMSEGRVATAKVPKKKRRAPTLPVVEAEPEPQKALFEVAA